MRDVQYGNSVNALLLAIPELTAEYEVEAMKWAPSSPHAHVVYGSMFCNFIRKTYAAYSDTRDERLKAIIERCFEHVEALALSSDFETRCLVEASVLESLLGESSNDYSRLSPYFGVRTHEMAKRLLQRWNSSD